MGKLAFCSSICDHQATDQPKNTLSLISDFVVLLLQYESRREKTGFLHMRKQRRRSASLHR